jgi:osmoprotectant transport system substrate-binding protein
MGNAGGVNAAPRPTRARAIALLAAAPALASCGARSGVVVGSKNFTEQLVLGELYAQVLEKHNLQVVRRLNLGGTQIAMEALRRGDIDLYPEYTGTALVNVLHAKPGGADASVYNTVKDYYQKNFQLTWLDPAPMNDTQALATTQALSQRLHITTLSQLSVAAPQLVLGAIPEFTKREDGLPGLQRAYGGFRFKAVRLFDIGLKYKALTSGNVDVVVAFGTDGQIAVDKLVVFDDDKHFWPTYRVAPVVRDDTLKKYPALAAALNALSPKLTDDVMRKLNEEVDGDKREPADVARDFLAAAHLA